LRALAAPLQNVDKITLFDGNARRRMNKVTETMVSMAANILLFETLSGNEDADLFDKIKVSAQRLQYRFR